MQAFVTDAFWEGGGEKYERHSKTSCLCNPSSYVYVNTDSAGTNIPMILLVRKEKKREIREHGNTFWRERGIRGGGGGCSDGGGGGGGRRKMSCRMLCLFITLRDPMFT